MAKKNRMPTSTIPDVAAPNPLAPGSGAIDERTAQRLRQEFEEMLSSPDRYDGIPPFLAVAWGKR